MTSNIISPEFVRYRSSNQETTTDGKNYLTDSSEEPGSDFSTESDRALRHIIYKKNRVDCWIRYSTGSAKERRKYRTETKEFIGAHTMNRVAKALRVRKSIRIAARKKEAAAENKKNSLRGKSRNSGPKEARPPKKKTNTRKKVVKKLVKKKSTGAVVSVPQPSFDEKTPPPPVPVHVPTDEPLSNEVDNKDEVVNESMAPPQEVVEVVNPYSKRTVVTDAGEKKKPPSPDSRSSFHQNVGKRLTDLEILVFAQAVCMGRLIGDIITSSDGKARVLPPSRRATDPSIDDDNDAYKWVVETDFPDTTVSTLTGNEKQSDRCKVNQFKRFLISIRDNESFGPLANLITNPQADNTKTLRFIVIVQFQKDANAKNLINKCMLCWALKFRKSDDLCYQPNYIAKTCRQIFTVLKSVGIQYDHSEFENMTGSYWNHFKSTFPLAIETQEGFAQNPNRASVEFNDEIKMRTQANPPYDLLNSYEDNMKVLCYKLSRDNANRVLEIEDMKKSQFVHEKIETGPMAGRWKYRVLPTNKDKTHKLSLGATNTSFRDTQGLMDIIEDTEDRVWSTYACMFRHMKQFPEWYPYGIWVYRAPEKVLESRQKRGCNLIPDYRLMKVENERGETFIKPRGKVGYNAFKKWFRDDIAKRSGFEHALKFLGRAARRTGISQLNARENNTNLINKKSRHESAATNSIYHDPNQEEITRIATAHHYSKIVDSVQKPKAVVSPEQASTQPTIAAAQSEHQVDQVSRTTPPPSPLVARAPTVTTAQPTVMATPSQHHVEQVPAATAQPTPTVTTAQPTVMATPSQNHVEQVPATMGMTTAQPTFAAAPSQQVSLPNVPSQYVIQQPTPAQPQYVTSQYAVVQQGFPSMMYPQAQYAMAPPHPQYATAPHPQYAMAPQPQYAMAPQPQYAMAPQPQYAMAPQPYAGPPSFVPQPSSFAPVSHQPLAHAQGSAVMRQLHKTAPQLP